MTALPPPSPKKLGLVIDLDICVGCHACATSCKEWNAAGIAGPLVFANVFAVFVGADAPAQVPGAPWLLAALLLACAWFVGWRHAPRHPAPA